MIVTRHTVVVKSGRMQEVVALIRAERERIRSTGIGRAAARIYLPQIGPTSMVAWEVEYENLAACRRGKISPQARWMVN
jgi:hypothetical protein